MFRIPRWHRAGRAGDVASLAVAAVVLHALAGPSAALAAVKPHASLAPATPVVVPLTSADSSSTARAVTLAFPVPVRWAAYDSATGRVIVQCDPALSKQETSRSSGLTDWSAQSATNWKAAIVACDLERGEVAWSTRLSGTLEGVQDGVAIVRTGTKSKFVDLASGSVTGETAAPLRMLGPQGVPLVLGEKEYARYDLRTGKAVWTRRGSPVSPGARILRCGDTLCVVERGLHMVELAGGAGWDYDASTVRGEVGKYLASEMGKSFLTGIVGGLTGRMIMTPPEQIKQDHDLFASPLIGPERIYYAARQTAVCLDRSTGRVVWKADLGGEPGSMRIVPAGDRLAIVGLGWYGVDATVKYTAPLLVMVSRDSGTVLARRKLDAPEEVLDVAWTANGLLLLCAHHLYRFSPDLEPIGTLEPPGESKAFVSLASVSDTVVIHALGPDLRILATTLDVVDSQTPATWTTSPDRRDSPGWTRAFVTGFAVPGGVEDLALARRREIFGLGDYSVSNGALLRVVDNTVTIVPPDRGH